jgi:hypothetical protein
MPEHRLQHCSDVVASHSAVDHRASTAPFQADLQNGILQFAKSIDPYTHDIAF